VLGLTDRLEGASRGASHFRGVTTVVTKLLCMASPDTLYLGQKDAQQVLVIRRLVTDLNLPVRIEVQPTVREPDGLALSSRNALLDAPARAQALALPAALRAAEELARTGEHAPRKLLAAARAALEPLGVRAEYLELVDPDTLEALDELDRPALLAIAAQVGGVRLIDNAILQPIARPAPQTLARTSDPTTRSLSGTDEPTPPPLPRAGDRPARALAASDTHL
jgi:pantoate--beta-alanine ligase